MEGASPAANTLATLSSVSAGPILLKVAAFLQWPSRRTVWAAAVCSSFGGFLLAAHRLWRRAASARDALRKLRLAEADQRARGKLPIMDRVDALNIQADAADNGVMRIADGISELASTLASAGAKLHECMRPFLADAADPRTEIAVEVVAKMQCFFGAWHDVGSSQADCSEALLSVATSMKDSVVREGESRKLHMEEALQLWRDLVEVEAKDPQPKVCRPWMLVVLLGQSKPSQEDVEEHERHVQNHGAIVEARLATIANSLEAILQKKHTAIADALGEARQSTGPVIEHLACVKHGRRSEQQSAAPQRRPVSERVKTLMTREGRRRFLEAEAAAAEEAAEQQDAAGRVVSATLCAPPVDELGTGRWRIKGVYEHQVLKIGLRLLNEQLDEKPLESFPRNKDGSSILFREQLLRKMMSGAIRLPSIANSDVVAAQRDIHSLTMQQLLRLRFLHLDFTPSGCGADTISNTGDAQQAFLGATDNRLFRLIGEAVAGRFANGVGVDAHRLGKDAVLIVAAASAISESPWWCWWITDTLRVFLHAGRLVSGATHIGEGPSTDVFPKDGSGVLQVTDRSKRDAHEPTGKLRWFEWRVDLVRSEAELSDQPLKETCPDSDASPTSVNASTASEGAEAAERAMAATGGGTGSDGSLQWSGLLGSRGRGSGNIQLDGLSPELLQGTRTSLRKVVGGPATK